MLLYSTFAIPNSDQTSALDLLCFALGNPSVRIKCSNKADTNCLLQNFQQFKSDSRYIPHPCTSDAVARINMTKLLDLWNMHNLANKNISANYTVWIAVVVKNDAETALEFLIWHFLLGVNHVLLYDNESTDNLHVALKPFVTAGLVEIIYYHGIGQQVRIYNDALNRARKENVTWLAAIDVDEYIAPLMDESIHAFLRRYSNQSFVGAVRLNWQYVTSMGKLWRWDSGKLNETVLDRSGFDTGWPDIRVKTIALVNNTKGFMNPHYTGHYYGKYAVGPDYMKKGFVHYTNPPEINTAVLLHFHVRTLEEWIMKQNRGMVSVGRGANHCPLCNSSLESLIYEWDCLTHKNIGTIDKVHAHCKYNSTSAVQMMPLVPASLAFRGKTNTRLSVLMQRQATLMHSVLIMPIEGEE